jgi:hypothetical protein
MSFASLGVSGYINQPLKKKFVPPLDYPLSVLDVMVMLTHVDMINANGLV